MATSNSVTAILRAQDQGYTSTLTKASSLLRKLSGNTKEASSSNQSFGGVLKGMVGALGIAKVASMAYSTAMANVHSAMSRQDTLYLYERNLKSAGFAADVVSANLTQLKDAVQDTAYGTDAAANSVQAFVNANMGLDKATAVTQRFMDLNSRYGDGTNETYKRIMFQMNQMATKGKASFQNINTAVESGIPVWQILEKQTGKSAEEIQKAVTKGEISSEQFFDALIAGSNEAAGAAKDGANTWAGSIGIMKARITLGVGEILTSFKSIGTKLTGDEFGIFKGITSIGNFVKAGFSKIGQFIESGFDLVYPYFTRFKNMLVSVKEPIGNALNAVKESLGKLWSQFDKVGALTSFQSILDRVGESITKFAGFIEKNADKIAKMISLLPKLVAGLTALNIVKSVGQKFAGFGADVTKAMSKIFDTGEGSFNKKVSDKYLKPIADTIGNGMSIVKPQLDKFTQNFKFSMTTLGEFDDKGKFLNFTRSIGESLSSMFPQLDSFRANLRKSKEQLDQFGGGNIGNFFKSFATALELSDSKIGKFASSIFALPGKVKSFGSSLLHPKTAISSLGASLSAFSTQAGGSGTVISGIALKIGSGLKGMATAGIGAIKGLGAAIMTNPIGLALTAITVGVVGLTTAWKSNFMNIQGFAKTAFGGVVDSLKSLKDMFTNITPSGIQLGDVIKKVGVIFAQGLGLAVGIVVDGFRLLVTGVAAVIKGLMALGSSAKMVAKAFKGDWKGAGEEFDKVKENINGIKDDIQNFGENSATKKVVQSFKELKDTSTDAKNTIVADFQSIGQANQDLSAKFSETSSALKEAFRFDEGSENSPSTEGMQKYFSDAEDLIKRHQERKQDIIEESNSIIQSAQEGSNEEQLQAQVQSAEKILQSTQISNDGMLELYQSYKQMLVDGKTREGKELSDEQKKALQEQTDIIRQSLVEQNQLYVDAAIQKISAGQKLSEEERATAIANLQALYKNKEEEILSNRAKIDELNRQANEAETTEQRKKYEAQVEDLRTANKQIEEEYQQNGDAILEILMNGGEANATALLNNSEVLKQMTNEQLDALLQSFVKSTDDTAQQLMVLAGIMEQKGIEGASKLREGLETNNVDLIAASMTEQMQQGLYALPDTMFDGGNAGVAKFIQALKSQDTTQAGKELVSGVATGANNGQNEIKSAGDQSADSYINEVKKKNPQSVKSGEEISKATTAGIKKEAPKQQEAGRQAGTKFNEGVRSQKGNANNAGKELATSAKSGAGSVDFTSVGSQMASGVAQGIRDNTHSAVSAMQDLVSKVNAEAKKKAEIKSPAQLFKREVGSQIAAGVGVGISEKAHLAVNAIKSVVADIYDVATTGGQNVSFLNDGTLKVQYESTNETQFFSELINRLDELVQQRMAVYLDSGALVGETAPDMDVTLGRKAKRERRNRLW